MWRGRFEEVDDFPWIWEKFQEDAIWERAGYDRVYTQEYMPGNPGMAPKGDNRAIELLLRLNLQGGLPLLLRDNLLLSDVLWKVFFALTIIIGVVAWLFVLAQQSRRAAYVSAHNLHSGLLERMGSVRP